jgi:2',3'-cyclic-nucleotide 2'-phosphodiesterase (5'-nucleotidase family)
VSSDYALIQTLSSRAVAPIHQDFGEVNLTPSDPLIWCRKVDCNLGRLVADAMLFWCPTCDFAHVNSGGLRKNLKLAALLFSPNVTVGDINAMMPFGDSFSSYSVCIRAGVRAGSCSTY